MPTVIEEFTVAIERSKALKSRPDSPMLLKLYGLYKQGTAGDNTTPKPGFGDMMARTKWTAWTECKGLSQEEAMQRYIDLVAGLE
ncbi:acyl-CoA-binding protein [Hylemonella sp. W303a]|uniref:acyl-CoA-binding protein n=1 Tax=Hylemonella sp. W303a TaxID=3389873 RepID=UPI00396B1286